MSASDAIYALATPSGRSGVAIIRVSGPAALDHLSRLAGRTVPPRRATLTRLRHDGETIDEALVLAFPGPDSFTGEDVAEFQTHGSPAVTARLARALSDLGARPAEPGEFTRRAFMNGRMDLTAVEGLADLIDAETEGQRRQALRLQGGGTARRIETWIETLLGGLALLEAQIDFADEGDVADAGDPLEPVRALVSPLIDETAEALRTARGGERMRDGVRIVVAGPPNAGKSTLLNALAEREVALVTEIAGTTRDALDVALDLGGVPVLVTDTAGLRETDDRVERMGIARAEERLATADLILWLGAPHAAPSGEVRRIHAKSDLSPPPPGVDLSVSAATGDGLAALVAHLTAFARDASAADEAPLLTRERQRRAVRDAHEALMRAAQADEAETMAEDLRAALRALHRLIGRFDVEDVLDALFRRFCIGK